ncbi:MAG: S8 family peptidase, partial [Planctomycetota bacterium]
MSRARSGRHAGASERISLALEALEPRLLLSGDSLLSSLISPAWFERVPGAISGPLIDTFGTTELSWEGESVEAVRDHWIGQFTDAAVAGINSVTETAGLLSDAVEFEVVQGLGMVGQVLIRTVDASVDAVTSWLSASPSVAQFGPDAIVTLQAIPNDPLFGSMWGLRNVGQLGGTVGADIDAALAWNLATGTSSIVTAVIDTGVDYTHPDLAANMWVNSLEAGGTFGVDDDLNGFIDDIYGWDFYDDDADPMDEEGHGTHVAGTIGAVGNNGIGVTGVNWTASIMAVRFLGPTGGGTTSDAIESVNYATMMKQEFDDGAGDGTPGADVRVTNNSWGGGAFDINLKNAIEASGNEGILFVAAAGNSGVDNDTFSHYPSSYDLDNIIAVAATDRFDQLADFSNFGPVSVDVAAPGVAILSTVPPAVTGQLYDITPSGTSMAAPHVAGIAALAWDYSPTATMEQVRDAILAGVEPLASLTGLIATGGRVNARAVLERVVYADPMFIQTQVVVSGGTTVTVFDVQGRINVGPADVAVKFGSGGIVSSLKILGTGDGMGIVISGAPSVGSVKDARKGTPWLAFLAADSAIKSVKLKTGFGGYNLNGLTLGGIVFGADIDGDGVTTDPIALYSSGAVGKVNLMGDSFGDAYMGGTDSKGLSTRSFKTKRGDFAGDVRGVGGAGKLDIGGNYLGTMAFAAGVSNVRIRGDLGTATPTQLPVPSVSIGDVVVTEGDSGTKNAVFIVTLS